MLNNMPKRMRQAVIASVLGLILISGLTIGFILLAPKEKPYVPGEELENLTNDLIRSIPEDYPKVSFTDITEQAGINFQHFFGERSSQLPEDMGSGVSWGDYNNDGWPDLFISNFAGPLTMTEAEMKASPARCALYRNNTDGTFTDVSAEAGLDLRLWANASAWADYDNDGYQDLFISTYGKNYLYRNMGDGTFIDQSKKAGIQLFDGYWSGVTWGDFNRDGYLDIYVCGYVKYTSQVPSTMSRQYDVDVPASINPSSFKPERNLLFRNNRDGTFTEMAIEAGVADENGRSLSASFCDLDEDGWPDIYVANDVSDNVLFKNLGNGKFKNISHNALVADYRGAMGIAIGDWDGDADFDMFITHWIAQENALYNNMRSQLTSLDNPLFDLRFMDEADRYGLGQIALDYVGWGTFFFDYDNDGRLDIFVSNGSTFQEKSDPKILVPMKNLLFWNKSNSEGFYEVGAVSGEYFKKLNVGRGTAYADFDRDGDLDLFLVTNGGKGVLLRNDGGNEKRWLGLQLEGTKSNKNAIGAKVRLVSRGSVQVRSAGSEGSYFSQNSPVLHFGLGQHDMVDSLEVVWPTGKKQLFLNLPSNKIHKIVEGQISIIQ